MQHVTGLYYRIKKTQTKEDIDEWLAERKRRYPSKENIALRQKQQEELLKRGERLWKPRDRFGKKTKKGTLYFSFSLLKNIKYIFIIKKRK